ncbi:hypothetical protein NIASO_12305 [Niabella soli DSM 19437]|uniref:Glycoside hydrolase family 127 protein n=1 Tax=Niabella soli DSM 19437 TaxID=929713 RepID=W0EY99_9BACT|nr:hypothetical protein NIASO_12305 [Niabella soli DSM 19437]
MVRPFTVRNEKNLWQSEFWGKWITSAIDAYNYTKDNRLLKAIQKGVEGLIATQTPDGYIGNYAPQYRLQQWDIWGMKYCLLGLLGYYNCTKDNRSLAAAKKLADYVISAVYASGKPFNEMGNHRGMAAASILEPVVLLYNITHQASYLKFADFIVASWSNPNASELIKKGLQQIPVGDRFPTPAVWYGPMNGRKAYEMMSCYEGLMELYRVEKRPEYLEAIVNTAESIRKDEIFVTGSGSSMESWINGAKIQATPLRHSNETCVTATWMKLCLQLLRTTGDAKWANEIERTFYNALLGAMMPDGHTWNKYTDLRGVKYLGENQCGMDINCCIANGPRGLMVLPKEAFMINAAGIAVNFYGTASATLSVGQNKVTLNTVTEYPKNGAVTIIVNPGKPLDFNLQLRIPEWSAHTNISINGVAVDNAVPGKYTAIKRTWKQGDIVKLQFQMDVRQYFVPGDSTRYCLQYGPLVLASDKRFQETPFYNYYRPAADKGKIPYEIVADSTANVFLKMKIPFLKEIIGGGYEKEYLTLTDFASAGNTWDAASAYLTWFSIPKDPSKDK